MADENSTPRTADLNVLALLDEIRDEISGVRAAVTKAEEWGTIDFLERHELTAGEVEDYYHRGVFKGVAIFNESDVDVRVGFRPGGGRAGNEELTLEGRSWIALPMRGSHVSVGADAAAEVVVIPLSTPVPLAAGSLSGAGTSSTPNIVSPAAGSTWDVSDRVARELGHVDVDLIATGQGKTLQFAAIDHAANGDNTIVAAQGAGVKIKVVSYAIVVAAAVAVRWKSGAGTNLSGAMPLAANGGVALPGEASSHLLETAANQALVLNLSAAVQVSGHVSYFVEA